MYENLESAAFDNFDPSIDTFDPDMMTGRGVQRIGSQRQAASVVKKSPSQSNQFGRPMPTASFALTIANNGDNTVNVELFNALFSISELANNSLYPNLQPLGSIPASRIAVTIPGPGTGQLNGYLRDTANPLGGFFPAVGFNAAGELVFNDETGNLTTVSCSTVPYRALLKATMSGSFRIDNMRMTFSSAAQINNAITWRDRTVLGGTKENNINPDQYFRPDQFQSLRVDVPVGLSIDRQKGLFFPILGGNTVNITMFVSQYALNVI